MDVNIGSIAAYRAEIIGLVGVEVDKIKSLEGRCDLQRPRRTALNGGPCLLRDVNAGAAETVDVIFLEVGGSGESPGVGRTVFFSRRVTDRPFKFDALGAWSELKLEISLGGKGNSHRISAQAKWLFR
jgi:hypothetical protein